MIRRPPRSTKSRSSAASDVYKRQFQPHPRQEHPMTNEAMSPLRRRMIEDMTIRNFGPKTQHDYVRSVRNLTVFLGRSPDTASNEDVRRFQLHLASDGISAASMNSTVSGLRFFFHVTLGRSNIASHLPFVRQPHKLPIVLSPEEVSRFLDCLLY